MQICTLYFSALKGIKRGFKMGRLNGEAYAINRFNGLWEYNM